MSRQVDEWIGKTPDTVIPPRVRLRVFDAHHGICALSGRKIQAGDKWELDHKKALINGGEHREGNLQPVLSTAHKVKTAQDVALKAKVDRVRKKHLGLESKKATIAGSKASKWKRKIDGTIVPR
jgi:5-methylcytosine-specific restriction enzyme A